MTVALKYACLSKTEWVRFNVEDSPTAAALYMQQLQLMSGWYQQRNDVLLFELGAAAVRIGAKIDSM